MEVALIVVGVLLAAAVAVLAVVWSQRRGLVARAMAAETRAIELDAKLDAANVEAARLNERCAQAEARRMADVQGVEQTYRARQEEAERAQREERARYEQRLVEMKESFQQAIHATAAEALKKSSEHLLKIADDKFKGQQAEAQQEHEARRLAVEGMVKPIAETLKKTDERLGMMERQRAESFGRLDENLRVVIEASEKLRKETGNLVTALRKPQVRGRYGEVQLRRVAELAGMRDYCDFSEQTSSRDDEGALKRPDMVVRLPNGRAIAVDAKTNIEAYLDAVEAATPEDAERHTDRFARHVLEQAEALAKKEYWARVGGTLDFVVMFIPGDQFVDAALSRQPKLLEFAAEKGVIIASPGTLIGLLRAVHVGWREKRLTDNAQELFTLGRELHERAAKAMELIGDVGSAISSTASAYNKLVGSVDSRLMPTLRKLEDAGAKSEKALEGPRSVETGVRGVQGLLGQ